MSRITTHVLDTARGRPAAGIPVTLSRQVDGGWSAVGAGVTDADGRVKSLVPEGASLPAGTYQLRFDTGAYLDAHSGAAFYPHVEVVCRLEDGGHYHLPLLLSPFGYSTYRGS